jgi:hypothetical protein
VEAADRPGSGVEKVGRGGLAGEMSAAARPR